MEFDIKSNLSKIEGLQVKIFVEDGKEVIAIKDKDGKIFIATTTSYAGVDSGMSTNTVYELRSEDGETIYPYATGQNIVKHFSSSNTLHENEYEEAGECGVCGGTTLSLGSLGKINYKRCRDCGMQFSDTDRLDIDEALEVTEEDIKSYVKETLFNNFKEHDLVSPRPKDWSAQSKQLRTSMVQLLKHIEDDEYEKGIEKIDEAISLLKSWKSKIQKHL